MASTAFGLDTELAGGDRVPASTSLRLLDYDLAAHAPTVPVLERICAASATHSPSASASTSASAGPNRVLRSRLHKALLRAADSGDSDVLAWLIDPVGPAWPHLFADDQPHPPPAGLKPDLTACRTESDLALSSSSTATGQVPPPSQLRGTGPLVLAASSGHLEVVRTLVLQAGCDIDERDEAGWTALMWAVSASNLPLVSFLLSNGADVEIQSIRGASVEDFLVTGAGTSTGALNDAARMGEDDDLLGPRGARAGMLAVASDRELIADMIYEQMRIARKSRAKSSGAFRAPIPFSGTPQMHSNTSYSVSRSSSPTKQFAHTPLRSPYNFSPGESSATQTLSPPQPGTSKDGFGSETATPSGPMTPPPHATLAHTRALSGPSQGYSHGSRAVSPIPSGVLTPGSLSKRKLLGRTEREQLAEAELRARELVEGRKRALLETAVLLEIDYPSLLGEGVSLERTTESAMPSSGRSRASMLSPLPARTRGRKARPNTGGLPSGCGALEVGSDPLSAIFSFDSIPPDQMLVFSVSELDILLDVFVTNAKPYRAPWARRAMPANALYLCARWAAVSGDEDLMDELVLNSINRVQEAIHTHHARLNHLVFWLFNMTLLLHYFQRDASLNELEVVVADYQPLLRDIVDEIFVFVIRDAERRIDKILDVAMLEHESVPGLGDDIRFEGEWAGLNSTLRSLAGSMKSSMAAATDAAGTGNAAPGGLGLPGAQGDALGGAKGRRPLSQIFSRREMPGSPAGAVGSAMSGSTPASAMPVHFQGSSPSNSAIPGSSPAGKAGASPFRISADLMGSNRDSIAANLASSRGGQSLTAQEALAKPTPRTITMLLSATLHVLQLYEINPCVIVQALSQIFYWIGCELFNRMLGLGSTTATSTSSRNKRFLCRSRAMHIRLNISALEDWARSNALPLSIVNAHITPLRELVSWLQCQSSLREFDALIMTMQSLRALNPAQMRKAVKEYRYEVGEGRMSEECLQYLEQLQKDWERRSKELEEAARQVEQRRLTRARLERQADRERLSPSERYRDREQSRAQTRGRSASPMLHPNSAGHASKHHRSGTATQDGSTPDSRSPSPSEDGSEGLPDISASKSVESALTEINEDDLSPAERIAHRAQLAIDSLFETGRSMNDYIPPWTAAGAPPGASGEVIAPCGPSGPAEMIVGESLHSREMLPFALPSKLEALVVTPGDAFGFGRGHFTGTGSPALKNLRAAAGSFVPPGQDSGISSSPSIRGPSSDSQSRRRSKSELSGGGGEVAPESASVTSGTSSSALTNASTRSSCSSLYPMGKGFAAGGAWDPVPILPDGFIEQVDRYLERVTRSSPINPHSRPGQPASQQQHYYHSDPGQTPTDANPREPPWLVQQSTDGHSYRSNEEGLSLQQGEGDLSTSQSARTEVGGDHQQSTGHQQQQQQQQHQKQQQQQYQNHARSESGLSSIPTRLHIPPERLQPHRLGDAKSSKQGNGSADSLITPIARPNAVPVRSPSGRQLL
ncbi:hypothetical protein A4X13_0g5953 [Tilletia indica]|uniref:Uncharacterized protein n=1 Tax=Tilletia indica TaxID=43049 RepID=A0A177TH69_9BASI|nr:hypothetical protein A4X13_0g5953 [Tilletia indica]